MGDRWSDPVWRRWKIETIRRSLAMVQTNQQVLSRDEAARLIGELQRLDDELRQLRDELRRLAEEA